MKKTITAAAIAAMVLSASVAMAADPVCGDVTDDGSIKTTDALLVLKKAVAQPVTLDCSAYDEQFSACQSDLSGCENAPVCGNSILEGAEDCEAGNLDDNTCVTQGFAGGTLACAAGCTFDTSGCYAMRFDASGETIIDHQTGLEWEKKNAAGDGDSYCITFDAGLNGVTCTNPHDVDNFYQWGFNGIGANGTAFVDFLTKLNGGEGYGCYAGHCDWRLPSLEELLSIPAPFIPEFQPAGAVSPYFSATTFPSVTTIVYAVHPSYPERVITVNKGGALHVRAVRYALNSTIQSLLP